ncbi:MAG: hypothetical protein NT027_04040 [Proteobacteria bacterium]|nr:hypothetical protein [Pseudomonadota bacterium]
MRVKTSSISKIALLLVVSSKLYGQTADSVPLMDADEGTKDSHFDSFSVGDVVPTPPPEGEPDTSEIDSRSPDEITEAKMLEFEALNQEPQRPFLIGLSGAIAFPHILNFGLESLFNRSFGVSANMGSVSRNIDGIDVGMKHYDLRFRYHPGQGSFFVGLGFGQHTLIGEKNRDIVISHNSANVTVPTKLKLTAKSNYVTPHVGWFAVWDAGFSIGLDVGALVPISPSSKAEASFSNLPAGAEDTINNDADYKKLLSEVEDSAQTYTKKTIPFLTMMRLGWMF